MSRPPRDPVGAATERITIRLTKIERAAIERLVAEAGKGASASSVIVNLLHQAAPPRVVDGWQVLPLLDRRPYRWQPKHVWTPHRVPGTTWTLVVRRRVLGRAENSGMLVIELGRGRTFELNPEVLEQDGFAFSERWAGDVKQAPALMAFDHVPTEEDDHAWWLHRGDWNRFVRQMREEGSAPLWLTDVRHEFEGPAYQVRVKARWAAGGDRRHDVDLGAAGCVDAYELHLRGGVADGRRRIDPRSFSPQYLEEIGASPWAEQRRRERRNAAAAEEDRRRRSAREGVPAEVLASAEVLELDWPCTADDVNRAKKRAAREHHLDHGGDEAKMKAAMVAADAVLAWIARRAA